MSTTTTQPTQIPFEPIREKLRKAIEQYKKNHPENYREYEEFIELLHAVAFQHTFDTKNIDEPLISHFLEYNNDEYNDEYDYTKLRLITPWSWYTWLHLAVLLESKELVQDVLQYGAQVDLETTCCIPTGKTALHFAAETGNVAIFQLLIDAGANINAQDSNGDTPLHYCVNYGHPKIARMLVKSGADINAKNCEGVTAIDKARINHPEIAKYLSSIELVDLLNTHLGISEPRISLEIAKYPSSIKNQLPQDHSLIEEKSATNSALVQEKNESSETAKVEDSLPQDQAEVEEESATSSSVPGAAPPESQEGKPNDEGFIGSIFKWLRLPPISGEAAEIIPFDPPLNKGKVVEVHYVAMPGQGAFEEVGDH